MEAKTKALALALQHSVQTEAAEEEEVYVWRKEDKMSLSERKGVKASLLPFEKLPNLPQPIIPTVDLCVRRADIRALG